MTSLELYAAYLVACAVIMIAPGPTVTLIVANSLRHGTRAGLLNVAGTQLGLAIIIAIVGIGLTSVIEALGHWFDVLRLVGAAYLVWLGWRMLRAEGGIEGLADARPPRGGFFAQGLLVALSNPKTLLFFGAFFPQFIDPHVDYAPADRHHGPDRAGLRRRLRQRLRPALGPRRPAPRPPPHPPHLAPRRRLPDRRRPVAGVVAHAVTSEPGS